MIARSPVTGEAVEGTQPGSVFKLIDCDIHNNIEDWKTDIWPYWTHQEQVAFGDAFPPIGSEYYLMPAGIIRRDVLADGGVPASDPKRTAVAVLDRPGTDRALLIPQGAIFLGAVPNPDHVTAISRGMNRWIINKWLASDARWRGVIMVAQQDPSWSVDEIYRLAQTPGMVGIYLPIGSNVVGHNWYFPIYQAAQDCDLPIVLHASDYGRTQSGPAVPTALHPIDSRLNVQFVFRLGLSSLIANGVFERFPRLKFLFAETGVALLPELMWKMDRDWEAAPDATPLVKRRPSEYVVERCKFTTQPFVEPLKHTQIAQMCDMIQAHRTLLFSSDYPHWDADEPTRVIQELPKDIRRRVMVENALDLFGSRLA